MLAFFAPGPWQMVIFLIIVLLLFGNRIPQVAKSLGKGITEFKKGVKAGEDDDDDDDEDEEEELPKKKSKKKVKKQVVKDEDEEEDEDEE